jgi:hypothetical protein
MTHPKYLMILLLTLLSSCKDTSLYTKKTDTIQTDRLDSIKKISTGPPVDTALLVIWTKLKNVVLTKNTNEFKKLTLDRLHCSDKTYSTKNFLEGCYKEIFDTTLLTILSNAQKVNQLDKETELHYFSKDELNDADFKGKTITLHQFQIEKSINQDDGAWIVTFDFIKTKTGYRLFGLGSYGGPICCR